MIGNYENRNPFSVSEDTIVLPNLTNVRYKNENGLFMLCSQSYIEDNSPSIKQYVIPKECKRTIQ